MNSTFSQARRGLRLWQTSGPRGTAQRVARAAYKRLDAASLEFPLELDDVADSRQLDLPLPPKRPDRSRRLRVGWISTPPGLGSGGHTTMFRMVSALEAAGHECTMFLYDRYDSDVRVREAIIRRGWPAVEAKVVNAREGLTSLDACVATSWQTAHVLARRGTAPMRRLYFVQDFEPFFYPRGAEYALAEDTYRFGFRCISVGHMVADVLREQIGITSEVAEFGCDTDVYRLHPGPRDGVVLYAKPSAPRRGFLLGVLGLQELHRRRPDVTIHLVGATDLHVPFPAVHHGVPSPQELCKLFNRTVAGVALSFTNVSLLAEELLASGSVPVVNDSPYARADVQSEHVRWAPPTPSGIADRLIEILDAPPDSAQVAASARPDAWRPGQATFLRAVEDEVYGP
jgi:glycosyltransferase involved in cell wall biosynthesis